jgi:hypothetical protein
LAVFEILTNEDVTVSAVASLVCDAPMEEHLDGMSFRSIAAVEEAFGMGDVSAAVLCCSKPMTGLFAVLRENKRNPNCLGRLSRQCLSAAKTFCSSRRPAAAAFASVARRASDTLRATAVRD